MFTVVYINNEPCVNAYKQLTDKLAVASGIVDGHKACSCRWIALDRFTMLLETPCNVTQLVPAVRLIHCIQTVKLRKGIKY
jgi:hypothetical protein